MSTTSSLDSSTSSNTTNNNNTNQTISILEPIGYSTSTCGYCKNLLTGERKKGSKSYGLWCHILSCQTYKELIDKGWRRSGNYLYKPDMRLTCCPQYTISLDTVSYNPTKSQKTLLKKFNSFIIDGNRSGSIGYGRSEKDPPLSLSDDPIASTSTTTTATVEGGGGGRGKGERRKQDSALTSSVAVNFNSNLLEKDRIGNLVGEDDGEDEGSLDPSKKKKIKKDHPPTSSSTTAGTSSNSNSNSSKEKVGAGNGGSSSSTRRETKQQEKIKHPSGLLDLLQEAEWKNSSKEKPFKHRFEYTLEPASYTQEKYDLFKEYQTEIHGESESKVTSKGFKRFLVDTPLDLEPTTSPSMTYGSHHALYRINDELIAFAVIDILPSVVSSVYFVWSPKWSGLSLGKISALREIGMGLGYSGNGGGGGEGGGEEGWRYMMGFYIHTCPKMKYKADYQPSSLLDPETNVYYPWNHCKPLLDQSPHTSFSNPPTLSAASTSTPTSTSTSTATTTDDRTIASTLTTKHEAPTSTTKKEIKKKEKKEKSTSTADSETETEPGEEEEDSESEEEEENEEDKLFPSPPPPGCLNPNELPKKLILSTYILEGRTLVPLMFSKAWHKLEKAKMIKECLAALGEETQGKIALWMG